MLNEINLQKLAEEIIAGRRLNRSDDLSFFITCNLSDLQKGAHRLQEHFCGNHIDLCTIINGRSGRCSEDCSYCAQSACHHTGIKEYGFMDKNEIIKNALCNEKEGVNRFAIVTSGRALIGEDFEKALDVYCEMKKVCRIGLCASHGLLTAEQFHRLHEAGVSSYHHNIETSRRFFPHICTTHTYDDKIRTIKLAQREGLCVCSGGIIGMGEDWSDRIDMAVSLAALGIESIPINALMPIKGTKLADLPQLPSEDILRTISFFRYINPTANIRLAAGRKILPQNGESALLSGASASITGNMLTTSGTTIQEDMHMLRRLGLTNQNNTDTTAKPVR